MKPVIITRTLVAGAVGSVCASQTPGAAGNLVINGTLATAGVATLDVQRVVAVTSGGDISNRTFIFTGTNEEGNAITETITGPNVATVSTTLNFKTVSQIVISGTAAAPITVDTTGVGSSRWVPIDQYPGTFAVALFIEVTGTANVTAQYTGSDVFAANALTVGNIVVTDHASLSGKTSAADSNIAYPPAAVRLKTNSGTGTAKLIVRQAALGG